jgi:hypothetical protein
MRVGEYNAEDGPKDKQDVELFFAGSLKGVCWIESSKIPDKKNDIL